MKYLGLNCRPLVLFTALGFAALFLSTNQADAALLEYEGFDYASGTTVAGQNGGVAIPLKGGPAKWDLPESLILTEQQLADMKAGKFYINVHTSANPGGAIRGQIKL